MVVADDGLASERLRVGERLGDAVHRRARDPARCQLLDPLGDGSPGERRLEPGEEDVTVRVARREAGEALVVGESGLAEHVAEGAPERLLRAGDDEPSVRRLEGLERHERLVARVLHPTRLPAARSGPGRHVGQEAERGLEEREVGVAAHAVTAGLPDTAEDRDASPR